MFSHLFICLFVVSFSVFLCFIELEWKLVFKAISGVSQLNETEIIDPYEVWHRKASYNEHIPEARVLRNTCPFRGHYKSSLALDWETRNITQVSYTSVVKVLGTPVGGQGGSLWTLTQKMYFPKEFFDQTRYILRGYCTSGPYF